MGLSPWRQRAKRIIEHALAQLPIGASYRAKRQALREAYPFGERANHPYRIWCEECTKAIGAKTKPKQVAPVVSVSPLGVECGWCQAASDRSCLACYAARRKYERERGEGGTTDWAKWASWRHTIAAGPPDPLLILAFADWLEEQDWPEQGAIERAKVKEVALS